MRVLFYRARLRNDHICLLHYRLSIPDGVLNWGDSPHGYLDQCQRQDA
jgi:hypothetical protein